MEITIASLQRLNAVLNTLTAASLMPDELENLLKRKGEMESTILNFQQQVASSAQTHGLTFDEQGNCNGGDEASFNADLQAAYTTKFQVDPFLDKDTLYVILPKDISVGDISLLMKTVVTDPVEA